MYYSTNSSFTSHSASSKKRWIPEDVLDLIHPLTGTFRCTGSAPSMRRRCKNQVGSFGSGRAILNSLGSKCDAGQAAASSELEKAAKLTLCYLHGNQAETVAQQWSSRLQSWASQNKPNSTAGATGSSTFSFSVPKSEWNDDPVEELRRRQWRNLENVLNRLDMEFSDLLDILEEKCRVQEEEKRQEREKKKKRDDEKRMKDEEDKRRKDNEARNEAIRERARLAKEKRDEEAREKVKLEARLWASSWDRYITGWEKIDKMLATGSERLPEDFIPWPVKSGLQSDIDEASVRLFYRKAPPQDQSDTAEKRRGLLSAERLRWHTDKVMQRFGPAAPEGKYKPSLDILARLPMVLQQEDMGNNK